MNFISDLLLFVLAIDKDSIANKLDFLEIDDRYLNKPNEKNKGKNKEKNNKNYDFLILLMRYNFGKFWNLISLSDKHKFIKMFLCESDINVVNIENNDIFSVVYNTLDKIIKYSDNVNLIDHVINFYDVDITNAIYMIEGVENYLNKLDCKISDNILKYSDKNEIINFRHNICMFWLGLNNQRKTKLINLADMFISKLNQTQLKIINEKRIPYKNYNIDLFDKCKKNVIQIKNYDELTNLIWKIEEHKKQSIIVDTIIFEDIDLSEYNLMSIPLQIKKIKFAQNGIKSIDQVHDGIEVINCDGNYISNIDNLPTSIKVLICSNNMITSLDNLPDGLEYLD
jgi:hypothetical protein